GTPTASISAGTSGALYLSANGSLQTTAFQTLTIGGSTTGNVAINPKAGNGTVFINQASTAPTVALAIGSGNALTANNLGQLTFNPSTSSTSANFTNNITPINIGDTGLHTTLDNAALPAGRSGSGYASYGNYMYLVGGSNTGGTATTNVYYAKMNPDGTIGQWIETASLPAVRTLAAAVAYKGYLYALGGHNDATDQSTVYYAPISSNGTVGPWNTTSSLGAGRNGGMAVAYEGYMYFMGGTNSSSQTTTYTAQINSNGTIGTFSTSTALNTARSYAAVVAHNGYVYLAGGTDGSGTSLSTVHSATLNGGVIGSWSATNALPGAALRRAPTGVLINGRLIVTGGSTTAVAGGGQSTVYSATLNNGVATWTTLSNSLTTSLTNHMAGVSNGYMYIFGGVNTGGTRQTTVYSTPVATSAFAFNTNSTFNQGNLLDLWNGNTSKFAIDYAGNIVASAGAVFKPNMDATDSLGIATANGTSYVNFDSLNQRMGIGTKTPTASLDVNGIASISGQLTLYGTNAIQTTANQTLTLGGSTTGNIVLAPNAGSGSIRMTNFTTNGGILYTNGSGVLSQMAAGGATQCLLGGTTPTFGSCSTGSVSSPFTTNAGAIVPVNTTNDFLLGAISTTSAKFAVLNIDSGTPTASVSATGVANRPGLYMTGSGTLSSVNKGTLTIGSSDTGNIAIGTDATARSLTIGNTTGATAVNINSGTGNIALASTSTGDITLNSSDTLLLDAAGVLELNSSAGVISIGNDAVAQNINLGTGAAARTITIGNITGATAVNVNTGTGGSLFTTTGAGDFTVTSGDDVTINGGGANAAISIGTVATAHTIIIGNETGASSLELDSGTGSISIGNAIAKIINIGNTTDATALNFDTGTGGINFGDNANTKTIDIGGVTSSGTDTINIATEGTAADVLSIGNSNASTTVAITGGNDWSITAGGVLNVASCTGCGDGSSNWTLSTANGTLSPNNNTLDLIYGGTTTASAKFAVLNMNGTGPATATVSGNLIVMPRNGDGGRVGIGITNSPEKFAMAGGNFIHTSSGDPTLKGTYDTSGGARGVQVSGKYAYVADDTSGLQIIDVSVPTSPTLVSTYNTSGSALGIKVAGNYAYVADGTAGLLIIDISNPTSPQLISSIDTPGNAYDIDISGQYAYLADAGVGLQIINISNPMSPLIVKTFNTSGNSFGVYISGKYAYVADETPGLLILDISNPFSPFRAGVYNTAGAADDVYVSGKYAYVADNTNGLQIINVSNPTAPTLAGSYGTTNAQSLFVSGKYAYVGDYTSGLRVIDVSNPSSPTLVGTYNTSGEARGLYVSGKYAYVADNASGLQIIDINGIETPSLYAGSLGSGNLTIDENAEIGNSLYVRNGLNVGFGGILSNGAFTFSTASGSGNLIIGAPTGNALLTLNNTGTQDIFTASASGTTRLVLNNSGQLQLATQGSTGGLLLGGDTTLYRSGATALTSNATTLNFGSAALTVSSCTGCGGGGSSNWTLSTANGTLSPNNNTLDFLLGGIATTSAKFAVLNMNSTTPTVMTTGNLSIRGGTSNLTASADVANLNKSMGANVTGSWSTGAAGGTARYDHTSVLYNGKIYSWGGENPDTNYFNTVDIYDIANNSWSTGTAGGTARRGHTSVLYNGKI
ncbi:MAG: kelch repeat-containing protein, partial [Candidatus Saccharibacteria bacterium]|nr:kelch repeat-containing protein [Candidatus Saccharibacteria bacterium]